MTHYLGVSELLSSTHPDFVPKKEGNFGCAAAAEEVSDGVGKKGNRDRGSLRFESASASRMDRAFRCARELLGTACTGDAASIHLYFENAENRRRYRMVVSRDLFGWLEVGRYWGALDTRRGGGKVQLFEPDDRGHQIARQLVLKTLASRRRRGYAVLGLVDE